MTKLMMVSLAILMCFTGYTLTNLTISQSFAATPSQAIQSIEVPAKTLGEGWKVTKSFYVEQDQLNQFATRFGAKIVSLKNDIFTSTNGTKVQINYIQAASATDAKKVYDNMINMVGSVNVVMLKNMVIIEVISNQVDHKEAAIKFVKPDKIHKNY